MRLNIFILSLILLLTLFQKSESFSLGCLFGKECYIDEKCVNDELFGVCLRKNEELIKPELELDKILELKSTVNELVDLQYSWDDQLTQCFVTKLAYNSFVNCPIEERFDNDISPNEENAYSMKEIVIDFKEPKHLNQIIPWIKNSPLKDYSDGLKFSLAEDGRSLSIAYNPEENDDEKIEKSINKLMKYSPLNEEISGISIKNEQEEEFFSKKLNKRSTQTKISKDLSVHFDKGTVVKVSLFTFAGLVCVAGIVGVTLFVHVHRQRSATNKSSDDKKLSRSSQIIKVQNKRLLHNDSESHVEDDDNAVFDVDETNSTKKVANRLSSASSGVGDPVVMNIDVRTGHLILGYMETHFKNPEAFNKDWEAMEKYEPENQSFYDIKKNSDNMKKIRSREYLPYEKTRVKLTESQENDFINASFIFDSNPKQPSYIAATSPLSSTVEDFWQMVWEQNSVVLVCLDSIDKIARINDPKTEACVRYWPREGTLNLKEFDIHLVSEHRSNLKYVVRSMYLKKKTLNETRTISQFHFHELPENEDNLEEIIPPFLEFRRKVNKSFRSKTNPVIVHSEDGCGMVGTYILLDIILNRIAKGVRELDIVASLEHLRDQRKGLVNKKEQFKFVTTAVAEEVNELIRSSNE